MREEFIECRIDVLGGVFEFVNCFFRVKKNSSIPFLLDGDFLECGIFELDAATYSHIGGRRSLSIFE